MIRFLKLDRSFVLSMLLITPSIFTCVIGLLDLPLPARFFSYAICFLLLFLIAFLNNNFYLGFRRKKLFCYNVLVLMILLYYTVFSASNIASYIEFYSFVYLVCIPVFIIYLLNFKFLECDYKRVVRSLSYFSALAVLFFLLLYVAGLTHVVGYSVIPIGMDNQIWFSRFLTDYIFMMIFYILHYKKLPVIQILAVISGFVLLYYTGSRAPVVAMFFAVAMLVYSCYRAYFVVFVLLFSPFIVYGLFLSLKAMFSFNAYSVLERFSLYTQAIELISANWFGYGNSSFGILTLGVDEIWYPHNIFLELLVNFGILGFLVFLVFLVLVFRQLDFRNVFSYLFVMALINSLSSGSLPGNNNVFVYGFIVLTVGNLLMKSRP